MADKYGAHTIILNYCDGSSFFGNSKTIRGRAILTVLMDYIVHAIPSIQQPGTTVILAGASAGGFAVLYNHDYLRDAYFPQSNLLGLLNGAFVIDVPVNGTNPPYHYYAEQFQTALTTWNVSSLLHPGCVSSYPAEQQYKCLMPQYLFPYVLGRFFILQSQFDTFQLQYIMNIDTTQITSSRNPYVFDAYANEQIHLMRTDLITLMQLYLKPGDGLFSSASSYHIALGGDLWNTDTIGGQTPRSAFWQWVDSTTPYDFKFKWMDLTSSADISFLDRAPTSSNSQFALIVSLSVLVPIVVLFITLIFIHLYFVRVDKQKANALG